MVSLYNEGQTYQEIAKQFGITAQTVRLYIKDLADIRRSGRRVQDKCKNGHEFTPENTVTWTRTESNGKVTVNRTCRICRSEYNKSFRAMKKTQQA
jgi:predicted transcriptional regulator